MSAALIPLTVAPFAAGTLNPITDAVLVGTILLHSYIGFQYVQESTQFVTNDFVLNPQLDLS